MAYNTRNPVPSTDARDYVDNVNNLDSFMNSLSATTPDRNGVQRTTWEGIVQGNGFFNVGTFAAGYTLTNSRQTLTYDGHEYGWSGAFPKSVSAGSTPTPLCSGGWIDRSDVTLRGELLDGPISESTDGLVLRDVVSVADYGAVDDYNGTTGTNNLLAFKKSFAVLNSRGGGDLHLPKLGSGIYYINGDDNVSSPSGVRIVADDGVSIALLYSGGMNNSPLVSSNITANKQVKIKFVNYGFTSYIGANQGVALGEVLHTVNNGDGIFSQPATLAGSNFRLITLANPMTALTPTSSTGESLTYTGTGVHQCAAIGLDMPGDEISALISSAIAGTFFAGVLTTHGYAYYSQNSGTQAVNLVDANSGDSAIVLGVPYALLNQQRDNFNNALLTVKVTSSTSFSVLVNGLTIGSYKTRAPIISAIFGTEDITGTVNLSQMFKVYGNSKSGGKALKILVCGDSISDNSVQYCWPKYMQAMLGSAGISVAEINNIAVAGQTAAQQYAILQTIGSGYDLCLIQVGVNDIQGATDFTAFSTTISNMVAYAKSVGMTPIVGLPTSFYSKAEANLHGQDGGQNTSNNAAIHSYRAVLARAVATAGGLLNMEPMKAYGAMSANWLDASSYGAIDSIVADNIHPTPYGSVMLGQGWARSVIGWLTRPETTKFDSFKKIPNSWLSSGFGTTDIPSIRGRELRGRINLTGTPNPDGAVAWTFPPSFKIYALKTFAVVCLNVSGTPSGVASMYVGADGKVFFFNIPASTVSVSVDGIVL